jgi:hypothetical protein
MSLTTIENNEAGPRTPESTNTCPQWIQLRLRSCTNWKHDVSLDPCFNFTKIEAAIQGAESDKFDRVKTG